MDEVKVGGWTDAWCTTCRTVREHVVVAMVDGRPAKVECESCHKQHLYRSDAPGQKPAPGARRPPGARLAKPRAEPAPPVDIVSIIAAAGGAAAARPYDSKTRFAVGEVVRHPTFGVGLVTMLPGPQRVEIAFQAGAKLLAHDRAVSGPQLIRPERPDDADAARASDAPPRPKL